MSDPVSIRTNNPGAQWYGPIAKNFGSTGTQSGLPGGNNAAIFPDPVSGAAAQFALLGKNYANMPLSDAISKWSGGNSSKEYTGFLTKQTGLTPDTMLSPQLLAGPQGISLAKAQAQWEAGKPYPMSDEQWAQAQAQGLGGASAQSAPPQGAAAGSGPAPQMPQAPYLPPQQAAPQPLAPPAAPPAAPAGQPSAQNALAALLQAPPMLSPQQLPPAWKPKVALPPSSLATIKPYFGSNA